MSFVKVIIAMVLFDVFEMSKYQLVAAKIDFNLIVSFLTTVNNKRTHQARQQVATKITISIIDKYNGHVVWVLKRTVSSKHFFECLKHNFTIEGKQPKPRFGCINGPSH